MNVQENPRRWWVLGAMALCMFIATADNTIMTVGLASIQDELTASNAELQWSMDAYSLVFAALLFTAGLLGDRFGRRLVLIAGMVIFAAASIVGAWSSDPTQLILWRGVMGLGAAVVPGCTMAVIVTSFPAAERTKAIGLWSVSAGVGIAAGPVLGGLLLNSFWWGSLLLINVPFAVVAIVMIAGLVPVNRNPAGGRLDLPGVVLSITGVGSLVYGIIKGGDSPSWLAFEVLGPIALGLVLLCVLVIVEKRIKVPSFDVALFGKRLYSLGSGLLAVTFFVATGATFLVTFYLQSLRAYSPIEAGWLMLPLAVGSMVAGLRAAAFVGRFGLARVLGTSMCMMTLSAVFFATMTKDSPIWAFEVVYGVFGFAFGLAFAVAMAAAMSAVPAEKVGAGSAVANTVRHIGTAMGIAVLGSILGSVYRSHITGSLTVLPADVRGEAATSLGGTLQVLEAAPDRASLLAAGQESFTAALHASMWAAAGLSAVATVLAFTGLPGKPRPAAVPATAQKAEATR